MDWVIRPIFFVALRLSDIALSLDFAPWGRRLNHIVALFFWWCAFDLAIFCDLVSGTFDREDLRSPWLRVPWFPFSP